MSDSELSDAPSQTTPPDAQLEDALREEVRKAHEAGDEYTVRTIRDACEKTLDLSAGFFKEHVEWKVRSSTIIKEESENVQSSVGSQQQSSVTDKASSPDRNRKRAVASSGTSSRKKVKTSPEGISVSAPDQANDTESDAQSSSAVYRKDKKAGKDSKSDLAKAKSKTSAKSQKDVESDTDDKRLAEDDGESGSESEMSVVLDDEPIKGRRGKSKVNAESKTKQTSTKPKAADDVDPDKEEIKRLQGQLVKCGVRKVWGKELKPYESSKAKIKHLREMLAEIGMTGRFSNDKAAQIKEARELAADIEAVQEGAQRWGKSDDEEGDGKTRGGRRLVRGAQNYDFLSSDGEETD